MPAPATAPRKRSVCVTVHMVMSTPSGHAETRRIDRIFSYRGVDSGEDVAQIAGAKVFHVGARELFSLAITSARIRHQDVVISFRHLLAMMPVLVTFWREGERSKRSHQENCSLPRLYPAIRK